MQHLNQTIFDPQSDSRVDRVANSLRAHGFPVISTRENWAGGLIHIADNIDVEVYTEAEGEPHNMRVLCQGAPDAADHEHPLRTEMNELCRDLQAVLQVFEDS